MAPWIRCAVGPFARWSVCRLARLPVRLPAGLPESALGVRSATKLHPFRFVKMTESLNFSRFSLL